MHVNLCILLNSSIDLVIHSTHYCTTFLTVGVVVSDLQGIDPDLHDFLVSRVSEDVYEDKALLPLEHLSADFQQSCIQCAAYFAGIQQQVSRSEADRCYFPCCMTHIQV